MIFQRSILREKITVAAVILLTLLTITSVLFLVKGLRSAAVGNVALDAVLQLMLVTTLNYFPLLVVVAVMIAIIVTVSRLYRDSEMAVWQSSGLSGMSLLRPVLMMVLPMFAFVLFLNTVLTPWTGQKLAEYRNQSNIQELSLLKNGTFRSAQKGERVFFVENVTVKDKIPEFNNVFVVQKKDKATTLITAQEAHLNNAYNNRAFLVLENGRQYDDKVADKIFQSMLYEQYGFSIDEFTKFSSADVAQMPVEQRSTQSLRKDLAPQAQGELYRRLSDSLMLLPMALFALVLGYVKPRGTRTWGVLAGLLLFVIYLNVIKLGESKIVNKGWLLADTLWLVHGVCLLGALLALWYRQHSWRMSVGAALARPWRD
ncbi:MAG: LPS export ABC transporter permease LptF [Formosimonas sp.]